MASNAQNIFIWWRHHVLLTRINFIPPWRSNNIHYKIIDSFPNFNGANVEVWEWMSNSIPHFTEHTTTYPCWDYSESMLVQGPLAVVYQRNLSEIKAWISNHTHSSLYGVITYPSSNFNCGFAKPPSKLSYGWLITLRVTIYPCPKVYTGCS